MGAWEGLKALIKGMAGLLYKFTLGFFEAVHQQSVEVLQLQERELENAFLSLTLGGLVGLPLVPIGLAAELAPLLKDEVKVLEERHFLGSDVISQYFGSMGGEW